MNRITKALAAALAVVILMTGCASDSQADVAMENNRVAAENMEILRRIVFVNTITDTYLLEIEGLCSWELAGSKVDVICKTGVAEDGQMETVRHSIIRSDNVSVVVEQLEANAVDTFHYRVMFRPEIIAPYIDIETSIDAEGDGS